MSNEKLDQKAAIQSTLHADMRLHSGLARRTIEQERKIVDRAVIDYRRGTLTHEKLWGFVGEIVGVRDLLSTVVTDVRVAEAALKSEEPDAQ